MTNTVKPLTSAVWNDLKVAGVLRKTRGRRGGQFLSRNCCSRPISTLSPKRKSTEINEPKCTYSRSSLHIHNQRLRSGPLLSSGFRNMSNLISVPIIPTVSQPKVIPKCLVINARSLVKADAFPALYCELTSHKADVCCISETWLNQNIPSHLICPEGFSILRKDRIGRQGGGVAILCRGDWQLERMEGNFSNEFECLWAKVSTSNSVFYTAVVYHPPEPLYDANNLIDFLANTCNDILASDPNSKLVICGDLNQLRYKELLLQNSLFQMVRSPTRKDKILDVFITNVPHLWDKVTVRKCLVRSDHSMVIACPRVPVQSVRKTISFRDAREQNKIKMSRGLQEIDWSDVFSSDKVDDKVKLVQDKLVSLYDSCFPPISVRVSSRDPPFVSPLVKHLLKELKYFFPTFEKQDNGKLSFLDVLLDISNNPCITSVFHKKTYTGLLTNYFSFTPFTYKIGLIRTLTNRIFKINNTKDGFSKDINQLAYTLGDELGSVENGWVLLGGVVVESSRLLDL